MSVLSTAQFTWDSDTRTFSAEASDLGIRAGQTPRHLPVKSQVNGKTRLFKMVQAHRDAEGDITRWTFRPVGKGLGGVKLVIDND